MSSVLRPVRKRKKVRTLGPVDVIDRKEYAELDVRGGPHPSDRCSSQLRWNPGS